jgi:arylsulfatase A-like enzyme
MDSAKTQRLGLAGIGFLAGAAFAAASSVFDIALAFWRGHDALLVEAALVYFSVALVVGAAIVGGFIGALVGIAAQAFAGKKDSLWRGLAWIARLSSVALVVTSLAAAGLVGTAPDGRERRIAPGPRPVSRLPNVVILVLDSLTQEALERAFRLRKTPCLIEFGEAATAYSQHRSICSWTRPSVSGMLTGLYPSQIGTNEGALSEAPVMLAERLHEVGYETAGVSSNYLTSPRRGFSQGHDYYWQKNNKVTLKSTLFGKLSPERWLNLLVRRLHFLYSGAPKINSEASDWFTRRDASRPFYLFLHYMDVHYPYYVYKDDPENESNRSTPETFVPYFDLLVGGKELKYPPFADLTLPRPQLDDLLARYWGSIEYIDNYICELFALLKASKQWDQTLVIVTSDHGEEFLEHSFFSHGNSLYDETVRVPLLIKWPHQVRGFQSRELVSGVQLVPTVLQAAGLSADDLHPAIRSSGEPDSTMVFSEFERRGVSIVSATAGSLKALFTVTKSGKTLSELYDVERDPGEKINLWNTGHSQQPVLQQSLRQFRETTRHQRSVEGIELTTDDLEALKALGYH